MGNIPNIIVKDKLTYDVTETENEYILSTYVTETKMNVELIFPKNEPSEFEEFASLVLSLIN